MIRPWQEVFPFCGSVEELRTSQYGMPAASICNLQCKLIHDTQTDPEDQIFYNEIKGDI
jgi:hypothetical protein